MKFTIEHKITGKDSLNKIYAGKHWSYRKKHADYWHSKVQSAMRKQLPKYIHEKPVIVTIRYNSRLDIDNHGGISKMIIDGMKGYLIEDDTRKYVIGLVQLFHEENYIEVEIEEIN